MLSVVSAFVHHFLFGLHVITYKWEFSNLQKQFEQEDLLNIISKDEYYNIVATNKINCFFLNEHYLIYYDLLYRNPIIIEMIIRIAQMRDKIRNKFFAKNLLILKNIGINKFGIKSILQLQSKEQMNIKLLNKNFKKIKNILPKSSFIPPTLDQLQLINMIPILHDTFSTKNYVVLPLSTIYQLNKKGIFVYVILFFCIRKYKLLYTYIINLFVYVNINNCIRKQKSIEQKQSKLKHYPASGIYEVVAETGNSLKNEVVPEKTDNQKVSRS